MSSQMVSLELIRDLDGVANRAEGVRSSVRCQARAGSDARARARAGRAGQLRSHGRFARDAKLACNARRHFTIRGAFIRIKRRSFRAHISRQSCRV